jgi:hypothetical protein
MLLKALLHRVVVTELLAAEALCIAHACLLLLRCALMSALGESERHGDQHAGERQDNNTHELLLLSGGTNVGRRLQFLVPPMPVPMLPTGFRRQAFMTRRPLFRLWTGSQNTGIVPQELCETL